MDTLNLQQTGTVTDTPEISLDFSDEEILDLIERKVSEYNGWYEKKRIKERTDKMVKYWRGDQSRDKGDDKRDYVNNVIHKDLATRTQNATSRMPDIVVMSPEQDDDPGVKQQTRTVEEWLSIRLDSDVLKRLAKGALMDNHLYLIGCWKYRYDTFRKDLVIDRIRPTNIVLDATARIPEDGFTVDNMEFIGEWIDAPTAEVLALYPDKKKELLAELDKDAAAKGTTRSSKIRYMQAWVTMHDAAGAPKELLAVSYNKVLLSKGPNPYWDEQEENVQEFGLDPLQLQDLGNDNDDQGLGMVDPNQAQIAPAATAKKRNHFGYARKPYTLFSGENIGDGPLDDTNVLEVSLPMQDIVNKRGNQISLINDWAIPKMVTSSRAMTQDQAKTITRDPTEVIFLDGSQIQDVKEGLTSIVGEAASPALYNDLQQSIATIDGHFSTTPLKQLAGESGEAKSISREQDLSAADDIAQTMVQRAVEEAANWLVQLAKIYFDEPQTALGAGSDRSLRKSAISSDLIPDGLQITVKANAVDKATLRNMSMNLVGSKGIDPMSLYEDLDYPNPKERAHRLIDFLNGPPSGYVNYKQDIGIVPGTPAGEQSEMNQSNQPGQPGQPGQSPPGMPTPVGMPGGSLPPSAPPPLVPQSSNPLQ